MVDRLDVILRWQRPERTMRYLMGMVVLACLLLTAPFGIILVLASVGGMLWLRVAPWFQVAYTSVMFHRYQVSWWGSDDRDLVHGRMEGLNDEKECLEDWCTAAELMDRIKEDGEQDPFAALGMKPAPVLWGGGRPGHHDQVVDQAVHQALQKAKEQNQALDAAVGGCSEEWLRQGELLAHLAKV